MLRANDLSRSSGPPINHTEPICMEMFGVDVDMEDSRLHLEIHQPSAERQNDSPSRTCASHAAIGECFKTLLWGLQTKASTWLDQIHTYICSINVSRVLEIKNTYLGHVNVLQSNKWRPKKHIRSLDGLSTFKCRMQEECRHDNGDYR